MEVVVKCNNECEPLCDFCIYATAFIKCDNSIRAFHGQLWCNLEHEWKELYEYCNNFHCFIATETLPEFPDSIIPNKWCPQCREMDTKSLTQEMIAAMPNNKDISEKERIKC